MKFQRDVFNRNVKHKFGEIVALFDQKPECEEKKDASKLIESARNEIKNQNYESAFHDLCRAHDLLINIY